MPSPDLCLDDFFLDFYYFLTQDTEVNEGLGDDLCIFQEISQNMSSSSLRFEDIITNCPQHCDLNKKFYDKKKNSIQCPIISLKTKGTHQRH